MGPRVTLTLAENILLYINTPVQDGAYRLYAPNLLQINPIRGPLRDLVRMPAIWSFVLI